MTAESKKLLPGALYKVNVHIDSARLKKDSVILFLETQTDYYFPLHLFLSPEGQVVRLFNIDLKDLSLIEQRHV